MPFRIVRELFQQYFNIAFLMGKPQDLPVGRTQLHLGVALALFSYLLALAVPYGVERAFIQAVVDIGVTGLVLWIALLAVGHPGRFEQAFGGFCGASMFINLAALPVFALRPATQAVDTSSTGMLADFVLLVWSLSLLAHVIRHTFEVRLTISVLLSFVFFLTLYSLFASIWPEGLAERSQESVSLLIEFGGDRALPVQLSQQLVTDLLMVDKLTRMI